MIDNPANEAGTIKAGAWGLGEVQGDLAMLFKKQYILTQTIETETRYRTETRTDSEGNTYTVEVPYTYYICIPTYSPTWDIPGVS